LAHVESFREHAQTKKKKGKPSSRTHKEKKKKETTIHREKKGHPAQSEGKGRKREPLHVGGTYIIHSKKGGRWL